MLQVPFTLRSWQVRAWWMGVALSAWLVWGAPQPPPLPSSNSAGEETVAPPGVLPLLAQVDVPEEELNPDRDRGNNALSLLEAQADEVDPDEADAPPVPEPEGAADPEGVALEPVEPEAPAAPLPRGEVAAGDLLLPPNDLGLGPGVLELEVFDSKSGAGLPSVIIELPDLNHPDRTDEQGRLTIRGLPVGPLIIRMQKTGYELAETDVEIGDGVPTKHSQSLTLKPIEVDENEYLQEEFEVVAEFVEEKSFELVLGQAETPSFQSSIGRTEFESASLSDAGDAVATVSGANVVGGKFAVLRGLADRYVTTTFNRASIASAEPSRKAVQLDLFPTSALEAIDVSKTYYPALPGDFGGGAIDVVTRVFPSEQVLSFKVKQSWDPSLPDDFLVHPDRDLDFLGGNVGDDLPQTIPTAASVPNMMVGDAWRALHLSRTLVPDTDDPNQPFSFSLTYGDTFEWAPGYSLGVMIAAGREREDDYNMTDKFRNIRDGRSWTQEDYTRTVDWNVYAAAGVQLGENHKINLVYFRKHIAEDTISRGYDLRDTGNLALPFGNLDNISATSGTRPYYGADALVLGSFYSIEPLERDFQVVQLLGEHDPFRRGPTFRWSFTNSEASERRPDTSFHQYATLDFASPDLVAYQVGQAAELVDQLAPVVGLDPNTATWDEVRQELIDQGAGGIVDALEANFPVINESLGQVDTVASLTYNSTQGRGVNASRLKQVIEERATDYNVGLSQPWYFDEDDESRGFELQAGTSILRKERSSRGSIFELFYEARGVGANQGIPQQDILPGPDNDGNGRANLGEPLATNPGIAADLFTGSLTGAPGYVNASTGTGNNANKIFNNADAEHNIDAYYLSGRLFWDNYYLLGGARFESEDRIAMLRDPKPFGAAGTDPPSISEAVLLPSLTAGVTVFDGHIEVMGSWSRTVARPTFHEWMPIRTFDLSSGIFRAGNPDLSNSFINNFDLTVSMELSEDFDLTVSAFHKTIQAPIVDVVNVADPSLIQYINGDSGVLTGVEVEGELRNLGPFTLRGNVTYIDATLTYPIANQGLFTDTVVRFPYQPEWITNLSLGYENEDLGLSANLIYNFTGEYSTILRSLSTSPDVVQNAQHALDLVITKTFGESDDTGFELKFGVKNLWATDREWSYVGGSPTVDGRQYETIGNDRIYFLEGKYSF